MLQRWYDRQTDGDWEHSYGVRITTLDNPGWGLTVDLAHTELAELHFAEVSEVEHERDWMVCRVRDGQFQAYGGPLMLGRMLEVFADWLGRDHAPPPTGRSSDPPAEGITNAT